MRAPAPNEWLKQYRRIPRGWFYWRVFAIVYKVRHCNAAYWKLHAFCTIYAHFLHRRAIIATTKTNDDLIKSGKTLEIEQVVAQVASIENDYNATRSIATVACDFGIKIEIFEI